MNILLIQLLELLLSKPKRYVNNLERKEKTRSQKCKLTLRSKQTEGVQKWDEMKSQEINNSGCFPETVTIAFWVEECILLGIKLYQGPERFSLHGCLPTSADKSRLINFIFRCWAPFWLWVVFKFCNLVNDGIADSSF